MGAASLRPPMPPLPPVETLPWHTTDHHVRDADGRTVRYRNVHGPAVTPPVARATLWALRFSLRRRPTHGAPRVALDPARLQKPPKRLRLAWLGHAAVVVQAPGFTAVVDPMLGPRASPLAFAGPKRLIPPALGPADLPPLDAVVLTHDHYDHADAWSLRVLARRHPDAVFVVPLGVGPFVRGLGARRVVELDWGQRVTVGGARLTATPARHFAGRTLTGRNRTLWCGYWIEAAGATAYVVGDTGYGPHAGEVRERLGAPDVALVPIGAYEPRWFMEQVHVDPPEALRFAEDVGARHVLPVHWGTFDLAEEPIDEPPRALAAAARLAGLSDRVTPWKVGEVWEAR